MTFSIVCRDLNTGAFAVATATGMPAVGGFVPHARAGAGAIATQGFSTNRFYGVDGLELLARQWTAKESLDALVARDDGRDWRQCLILDAKGRSAIYCGRSNEAVMAFETGDQAVFGGNMLANDQVIRAMADRYAKRAGDDLVEHVLATMEAGQHAGGDKRGTCSAALLIEYPDSRRIDLRIDYDTAPIDALRDVANRLFDKRGRAFLDRLPTRDEPHRA